ncbi:MAG: Hsp70 family protein, partial [Gammaproteobacteria bacterium]|nr:Hsp70 family protein [Gammaproteobacteria bacterium]
SFDIDANGILNVSAKDKATGKEQSIVIKASSGLSEDEIGRMVQDAEAHAEEDKKFAELVSVRNQADQMIHATEKSLSEMGDKVGQEERMQIENAVKDLKAVLDKDDKDVIQTKTQALAELSGKLAERMYAQAGGDVQQEAPGDAQGQAADEEVVDAEFEEVDNDDKKS